MSPGSAEARETVFTSLRGMALTKGFDPREEPTRRHVERLKRLTRAALRGGETDAAETVQVRAPAAGRVLRVLPLHRPQNLVVRDRLPRRRRPRHRGRLVARRGGADRGVADAAGQSATRATQGGDMGSAVTLTLGHPFAALAWLANQLTARGSHLKAGELVLTGSVVQTNWVAAGDRVVMDLGTLGAVELSFA